MPDKTLALTVETGMNDTNTYITQYDLDRLEALISMTRRKHVVDLGYLDSLEEAMLTKSSIDPRSVPADVVTMNSRARLSDPLQNRSMVYTLVFPTDADPDAGKISVFAPLGQAMLGAIPGQDIECTSGGNTRRLRVEEILYQPEAAGEFHL